MSSSWVHEAQLIIIAIAGFSALLAFYFRIRAAQLRELSLSLNQRAPAYRRLMQRIDTYQDLAGIFLVIITLCTVGWWVLSILLK
ncbi:MAG: hypothetical protein QXI19_12905 [Candidatus Caldarchaeum sp.]